ncbi:MAG: hypothetical protein AAF687_01385 [Pseudomonadota bacterium]
MLTTFKTFRVLDESGWTELANTLAESESVVLTSIFEEASERGCKSVLVEFPYVDRDFSAAFSSFYSTLFRPYKKLCRRLHFFTDDLSRLSLQTDPLELLSELENASPHYMGYVVLRPLAHAPISRGFFSHKHFCDRPEESVLVRAEEKVHVLGAELLVEGFPYTEQDGRTGACAQSAIWMAARHFHLKHGGPWIALPQITASALFPTDSSITQSLPEGSGHLTDDGMLRALKSMGRHPVFYAPHDSKSEEWRIDPFNLIYQYIDSGIPVILGVDDDNGDVGHAVVAVGAVRKAQPNVDELPNLCNPADLCSHFMVMDDCGGPYRQMPIWSAGASADWYNLEQHLKFIIVPLPNKVFMPAEKAEETAVRLLRRAAAELPVLSEHLEQEDKSSWPPERAFYTSLQGGNLLSRTYLTFGWKYKARMLRNTVAPALKGALLERDFPKYVWVTEFAYTAEAIALDPSDRAVRAHTVIDATGSGYWESQLILDCPGLVAAWDFAVDGDNSSANLEPILVGQHQQYYEKVRGRMALS